MCDRHKALKTLNNFMLFQKIQKYNTKDTNTTCGGPGYLWQIKYGFQLNTIQCTGTSKHAKLQRVR